MYILIHTHTLVKKTHGFLFLWQQHIMRSCMNSGPIIGIATLDTYGKLTVGDAGCHGYLYQEHRLGSSVSSKLIC